ncbi:DNA-binding protein, partial [Paraburkholderia sp. RL17-373-BIF-A]
KELREKSRVRIEHPDLPADLQAVAGELVATLWTRSSTAARDALDALRDEIEVQRGEAQRAVVAARDELARVE